MNLASSRETPGWLRGFFRGEGGIEGQAEFSEEIDAAIHGAKTRMSTAEAKRHLLAVLLAAQFIAEAMRKLSNARIEGGLPELRSAMKKLTTQQVTDAVNQMLETSPSLFDDDTTSSTFMKIFGGGQIIHGKYAPLQIERVKEALRLRDNRRG